MTLHPRNAGRPVRHEEVGRSMILERTRAAMRDRPMVDLQRQEIAKVARVSPALISYYFPDRSSLFAAAARPVIAAYASDMRRILAGTAGSDLKLRALVRLFVSFNATQGHLLEFYLAHAKEHDANGLEELDVAFRDLSHFFEDMLKVRFLRGNCPNTLRSMLWGMCRHVAARLRERPQDMVDEVIAAQAEAIYECFVNGAGRLGPVHHVASAA